MKNTDTLKKNYEFRYRLARGKYYSGKCFYIYVLKNKIGINKIGIAVSKKTGNAVCRNKIKRWVRESYTKLENNINGNYDIVFVWKKSQNLNNTNFNMVYLTMKNLFEKGKII